MLAFIKSRLDPRIWDEIWTHRKMIIPGIIFSALASMVLGAYAPVVQGIVQAVTNGNPRKLIIYAGYVVAIFVVRYFLTRGQLRYLGLAANRLTADLRKKVYTKLVRLPISYFNDRRTGGIQSILTNDINVYQSAVGVLRDSIDGPIKLLVGVVAIFVIEWRLALAAAIVFPFMAIVIQRNARRMKKAQGDVQNDLSDLTAFMQESISGMRVIRAFSAEERMRNRFEGHVEQTYDSMHQTVRITSRLKPLVELIGATAVALVILATAGLVSLNQITAGELMAFIAMLDIVNQGSRNVSNLNQTGAQISAAADRIYGDLMEAEETTADQEGAKPLANPVGRIEFENVSFTYPDGTVALSNVSFTIEPGTSLALVGPSGAGKSTIADLLLRYYDPTGGRILFDGVDIRGLPGTWYREQIGVVPQQAFLFADTIEENLKLGRPEADRSQVESAAEFAHADGFIRGNSEGYETVLGERGVRLSGGEQQRLAIARALLKDPKVLLMDEATSNLDAQSERIVTQALEDAMQQRTTLFIAHRLTTASRADKIIMMKQGQAVEQGRHEELLAQQGSYAAMYRIFAEGAREDAGL